LVFADFGEAGGTPWMLQRRHGRSERLNIFFPHASDNLRKLGGFRALVRGGLSSQGKREESWRRNDL
jgi:hypothetical protein